MQHVILAAAELGEEVDGLDVDALVGNFGSNCSPLPNFLQRVVHCRDRFSVP